MIKIRKIYDPSPKQTVMQIFTTIKTNNSNK